MSPAVSPDRPSNERRIQEQQTEIDKLDGTVDGKTELTGLSQEQRDALKAAYIDKVNAAQGSIRRSFEKIRTQKEQRTDKWREWEAKVLGIESDLARLLEKSVRTLNDPKAAEALNQAVANMNAAVDAYLHALDAFKQEYDASPESSSFQPQSVGKLFQEWRVPGTEEEVEAKAYLAVTHYGEDRIRQLSAVISLYDVLPKALRQKYFGTDADANRLQIAGQLANGTFEQSPLGVLLKEHSFGTDQAIAEAREQSIDHVENLMQQLNDLNKRTHTEIVRLCGITKEDVANGTIADIVAWAQNTNGYPEIQARIVRSVQELGKNVQNVKQEIATHTAEVRLIDAALRSFDTTIARQHGKEEATSQLLFLQKIESGIDISMTQEQILRLRPSQQELLGGRHTDALRTSVRDFNQYAEAHPELDTLDRTDVLQLTRTSRQEKRDAQFGRPTAFDPGVDLLTRSASRPERQLQTFLDNPKRELSALASTGMVGNGREIILVELQRPGSAQKENAIALRDEQGNVRLQDGTIIQNPVELLPTTVNISYSDKRTVYVSPQVQQLLGDQIGKDPAKRVILRNKLDPSLIHAPIATGNFTVLDASQLQITEKSDDGILRFYDADGHLETSVDAERLRKESMEKGGDVLQNIDAHPTIRDVAGRAAGLQENMQNMQLMLQTAMSSEANPGNEFIDQLRDYAGPMLQTMEDSTTQEKVFEAKAMLQEELKSIKLGKYVGEGVEREIKDRIDALDSYIKVLSDNRLLHGLQTAMELRPSTWESWRSKEGLIMLGAIIAAVVAIAVLSIFTGGAFLLTVPGILASSGVGALAGVAGAEGSKELLYQYHHREGGGAQTGEYRYTDGARLFNYARGQKIFDKQSGEFVEMSFLKDVASPYAQEFFFGFVKTAATMGFGSVAGKAISRIAQNSRWVQAIAKNSTICNSIMKRMSGLTDDVAKTPGMRQFAKDTVLETLDELGDEAKEGGAEAALNRIDSRLGMLSSFILAAGKGFKPLNVNTLTYGADANADSVRAWAEEQGHSVASVNNGVFEIRTFDGQTMILQPETVLPQSEGNVAEDSEKPATQELTMVETKAAERGMANTEASTNVENVELPMEQALNLAKSLNDIQRVIAGESVEGATKNEDGSIVLSVDFTAKGTPRRQGAVERTVHFNLQMTKRADSNQIGILIRDTEGNNSQFKLGYDTTTGNLGAADVRSRGLQGQGFYSQFMFAMQSSSDAVKSIASSVGNEETNLRFTQFSNSVAKIRANGGSPNLLPGIRPHSVIATTLLGKTRSPAFAQEAPPGGLGARRVSADIQSLLSEAVVMQTAMTQVEYKLGNPQHEIKDKFRLNTKSALDLAARLRQKANSLNADAHQFEIDVLNTQALYIEAIASTAERLGVAKKSEGTGNQQQPNANPQDETPLSAEQKGEAVLTVRAQAFLQYAREKVGMGVSETGVVQDYLNDSGLLACSHLAPNTHERMKKHVVTAINGATTYSEYIQKKVEEYNRVHPDAPLQADDVQTLMRPKIDALITELKGLERDATTVTDTDHLKRVLHSISVEMFGAENRRTKDIDALMVYTEFAVKVPGEAEDQLNGKSASQEIPAEVTTESDVPQLDEFQSHLAGMGLSLEEVQTNLGIDLTASKNQHLIEGIMNVHNMPATGTNSETGEPEYSAQDIRYRARALQALGLKIPQIVYLIREGICGTATLSRRPAATRTLRQAPESSPASDRANPPPAPAQEVSDRTSTAALTKENHTIQIDVNNGNIIAARNAQNASPEAAQKAADGFIHNRIGEAARVASGEASLEECITFAGGRSSVEKQMKGVDKKRGEKGKTEYASVEEFVEAEVRGNAKKFGEIIAKIDAGSIGGNGGSYIDNDFAIRDLDKLVPGIDMEGKAAIARRLHQAAMRQNPQWLEHAKKTGVENTNEQKYYRWLTSTETTMSHIDADGIRKEGRPPVGIDLFSGEPVSLAGTPNVSTRLEVVVQAMASHAMENAATPFTDAEIQNALEKIKNPLDQAILKETARIMRAIESKAGGRSLTDAERWKVLEFSARYLQDFRAAKFPASPEQLLTIVTDNAVSLAHQQIMDHQTLVGSSHGILHVLRGNATMLQGLYDQLKFTPEQRILALQATLDHDVGYGKRTLAGQRFEQGVFSASKDHPLESTLVVEANRARYETIFGRDGYTAIRNAILDHSDPLGNGQYENNVTKLQLLTDSNADPAQRIAAAVALVDCLATVNNLKTSPLLRNNPEVMAMLCRVGEIHARINELKAQNAPQLEIGELTKEATSIRLDLQKRIERMKTSGSLEAAETDAYLQSLESTMQIENSPIAINLNLGMLGASVSSDLRVENGKIHVGYAVDPKGQALLEKVVGLEQAKEIGVEALMKAAKDFGGLNDPDVKLLKEYVDNVRKCANPARTPERDAADKYLQATPSLTLTTKKGLVMEFTASQNLQYAEVANVVETNLRINAIRGLARIDLDKITRKEPLSIINLDGKEVPIGDAEAYAAKAANAVELLVSELPEYVVKNADGQHVDIAAEYGRITRAITEMAAAGKSSQEIARTWAKFCGRIYESAGSVSPVAPRQTTSSRTLPFRRAG